jgi:hypothetical protein
MSTAPDTASLASLERRALEERTQLHQRATELKTKVQQVRENLDVHRNARRYLGPASAIVGGIGLLLGYAVAGLFTDH